MADHRRTSLLKQELEKEEALLKNIKDKLVDQLQRLKVEELAIIGISNSTTLSQTASSTGSYFNTNIQVNTDTYEINEVQVNSVPLVDLTEGLTNNSLILSNHPAIDQEEDEDDD